MASYDKKISQFNTGTVDLNSYFLQANDGASTKVPITEITNFTAESRLFADLATTAKTLVGAINELKSALDDLPTPPSYEVFTDTLVAGNTTVTFSDGDIEATSKVQVFTNPPTAFSLSLSAGEAELTFTAQADDVEVELWLWT